MRVSVESVDLRIYDVQTFGIGVGGTGGICCGSLRIAFAYPRCCCLDWRRVVFRQPSGRLIGIEVMLSFCIVWSCDLGAVEGEAVIVANLKSGVEHLRARVVEKYDWSIYN